MPRKADRKKLAEDVQALGASWDKGRRAWRLPKARRAEIEALFRKHGFPAPRGGRRRGT